MKISPLFSSSAALFFLASCGGSTLTVADNTSDASVNPLQGDPDGNVPTRDGGVPINDANVPTTDGGSMCSPNPDPSTCLCGTLTCVGGEWQCPCNDCPLTCKASEVCLRDQVLGGNFPQADGGSCPSGYHLNSASQCELDPTFTCAPAPFCLGTTAGCACAEPLCSSQNSCPYKCVSASAVQVNCECGTF